MTKTASIIASLTCLFWSTSLFALDTVDLWMTKTAGIWEHENSYGYYQVAVYREGVEHAIDNVEVKEIIVDEEKNKKRVSITYRLASPGIKAYVHDISFQMIDSNRMLLYLDLEMKAMHSAILREVYLLGPNGQHRLVDEAAYQDLDFTKK